MCQGLVLTATPRAMSQELAAVWICRQPAERLLGLAAGKYGKLIVTVQGDGVITYSAAKEASGHSRALGSSQFLAPVLQLDNSYVAAVQQGSTHGVLLTTPVSAQQTQPLLDAEQQLPLPAKLHSLHVMHPANNSSIKAGPGVAAVVLTDGTVASANFDKLCLHPAAGSNSTAGASHPRVLSTACDCELLAVAQQQQGSQAVTVDVYTACHSNTDSSMQQQPQLQLCHSCSIPQPSAGSKLLEVCVAQGLLLLRWSCTTLSLYRCSKLGQPGVPQSAGNVAQLQVPTPLAAVLAAAAAAGGGGAASTPADRPGKRKQRTPAASGAAGCSWAAAALSGQHVLLLVLHSQSGGSRAEYAVLDSTFGSCLMSGSFSAGAATADDDGSRLQLLPLPQHPFAPVALLAAGTVWLLPLQLPKADLAGLVANMGLSSKQAATAAALDATGASTNQVLTQRQHLNLASIAAAVSSSSAGGQQQRQGLCMLQQLQQPAANSTAAADARLPAALQQLQRVLELQKRPPQELQAAVEQLCDALEQQQQQAASSIMVSQPLVAQALSALADAQHWPLLERLHQLQPLQSLAACADLVPALAAAQQYGSMRQVLLAAQEIPAEAVVKAVQHILQDQQQQQNGPSDAQSAATQQIRAAAEAVVQQAEDAAAAGHLAEAEQLVRAARAAAAAVDSFTTRELLLHVLLSVQIDGVEAQAALRALPAAAVLRLLRYLVKWLRKHSRDSLTTNSTDPLLFTPTKAQVLEWCRLLLDAQLTKLLLLPAAQPLLQQLQKLLQAEVSCTSKLLALKGVTDTWSSGAPLPAAAVAAHSQYVLELLDLRVKPLGPAAAAGAAAAARHK